MTNSSSSTDFGKDPQDRDRMMELLADHALEGLAADDAAELDRLMKVDPSAAHGVEDFERATAAAFLAIGGSRAMHEAMPASLRAKLGEAGKQWSASRSTGASATTEPKPSLRLTEPMTPSQGRRSNASAIMGWLAAAACLILAVTAWMTRPSSTGVMPALTTTQQRDQLLATAPDLVQWNWTATPDPAAQGASGDVVWSTSRQQGYMRFRGLAKNDPKREQYQLWIFDKNRPDATPVDGGVFDITADGDVIVPIDAKIQVFEPAMFAVTVEEPGGVVVSLRERIPVLAKPAE